MLQTIKKYWFVCLVGVLLIGASIYFAYDQNKGKLPGKTVGGEDVVFSIGDEDITAGEFYDTLFNEMGVAGVYQFMEKAVVLQSIRWIRAESILISLWEWNPQRVWDIPLTERITGWFMQHHGCQRSR